MKIKLLLSALLLLLTAGLTAQQTMSISDSRNVDHTPYDFKKLLRIDFKKRTTIGIAEGHYFKTVISLSAWGDPSGGYANQLAFDKDNMYMRSAPAGNSDWSASDGWRKLAIFDTNGSLNTPGDLTVTGNATISGSLLSKGFPTSDLDDTFLTSSRQFSFASGSLGAANRPSTSANYFSTLNIRHRLSTDYQSQISMGSYNSGLFFRSKVNGTWQGWKEAMTTEGGTISGNITFNTGYALQMRLTAPYDQFKFEVPGENRYWIMSKTQGAGDKAYALYSPDDGGWFTYWKEGTGDMIINKGKVGVGTNNPKYTLDVAGAIGNNGVFYTEAAYFTYWGIGSSWVGLRSRGINVGELTGATTHYGEIITGDYDFRFKSNGSTRMFINKTSGNVGIGTSNPSAKLDVVGNGQVLGELISKRSDQGIILKSKNLAPTSDPDQFILAHDFGNVSFQNVRGKLLFKSEAVFEDKVVVDNDIIAKKLRVTADPSAVPDYVFQPSYELKTLAEVEVYVKANSHLPGIPSAGFIGNNGQDVGEMQLKLLEKIEELTLYAIDSDKKQKALDSANEQLKSENALLKETLASLIERVEQLDKKIDK